VGGWDARAARWAGGEPAGPHDPQPRDRLPRREPARPHQVQPRQRPRPPEPRLAVHRHRPPPPRRPPRAPAPRGAAPASGPRCGGPRGVRAAVLAVAGGGVDGIKECVDDARWRAGAVVELEVVVGDPLRLKGPCRRPAKRVRNKSSTQDSGFKQIDTQAQTHSASKGPAAAASPERRNVRITRQPIPWFQKYQPSRGIAKAAGLGQHGTDEATPQTNTDAPTAPNRRRKHWEHTPALYSALFSRMTAATPRSRKTRAR
jgi:hypothetical protein